VMFDIIPITAHRCYTYEDIQTTIRYPEEIHDPLSC